MPDHQELTRTPLPVGTVTVRIACKCGAPVTLARKPTRDVGVNYCTTDLVMNPCESCAGTRPAVKVKA